MTQKTSKKTRIAKPSLSKKSGFKLRWWMGVILVLLVAIIGIIIIRFSKAAEPGSVTAIYKGYDGKYDNYSQIVGGYNTNPRKYLRIHDNIFGTADTYPAKCYDVQLGQKYGYVTMNQVSGNICGGYWANQPDFWWPVESGALTQCWGNNALQDGRNITNPSWASGGPHPGIDVGVGVGTPIHAVDNGTIQALYEANQTGGYGKLLILRLDNGGVYAGYAHLNDFNDAAGTPVKTGNRVYKGWIIGHSGNSGNVPAHLHFMVQNTPSITNGSNVPAQNLNPLNFLPREAVHNEGQCLRT